MEERDKKETRDGQSELDEKTDLFAPFPWGSGQTLLREGLLASEHAAYHCGQLVILRQMVAD